HQGLDGRRVGEISREPLTSELGRELLERLDGAGDEHDARTPSRKLGRQRRADPAGRAGHHDSRARQPHVPTAADARSCSMALSSVYSRLVPTKSSYSRTPISVNRSRSHGVRGSSKPNFLQFGTIFANSM